MGRFGFVGILGDWVGLLRFYFIYYGGEESDVVGVADVL
jgi:hypothetical protein